MKKRSGPWKDGKGISEMLPDMLVREIDGIRHIADVE